MNWTVSSVPVEGVPGVGGLVSDVEEVMYVETALAMVLRCEGLPCSRR